MVDSIERMAAPQLESEMGGIGRVVSRFEVAGFALAMAAAMANSIE